MEFKRGTTYQHIFCPVVPPLYNPTLYDPVKRTCSNERRCLIHIGSASKLHASPMPCLTSQTIATQSIAFGTICIHRRASRCRNSGVNKQQPQSQSAAKIMAQVHSSSFKPHHTLDLVISSSIKRPMPLGAKRDAYGETRTRNIQIFLS